MMEMGLKPQLSEFSSLDRRLDSLGYDGPLSRGVELPKCVSVCSHRRCICNRAEYLKYRNQVEVDRKALVVQQRWSSLNLYRNERRKVSHLAWTQSFRGKFSDPHIQISEKVSNSFATRSVKIAKRSPCGNKEIEALLRDCCCARVCVFSWVCGMSTDGL